MNIDDIKDGEYYKGYTDSTKSDKAWLYVISMVKVAKPGMVPYFQTEWAVAPRKVAGNTWKPMPVTYAIDEHDDAPEFRRAATRAEVLAEGFPPYAGDKDGPVVKAPEKVWPEGKYAIKENATSMHCVRCKLPTKEVVLFMWISRYCPICEG